jgi:Flp pilus assembly pilin Flp
MRNESGQGCAEYALILFLVVLVGLVAVAIAGGTIASLLEEGFNHLDDTMSAIIMLAV